jgi:acetyl-CoA synthetase
VPLLINTLTPPDLLQFYLADSGSAVAICDSAFIDRFNCEACRDTKLQAVVVTNGEGSPPGPVRALPGAEWLGRPPGSLAPADTRRDDMAFWMYSSGSTGRPKGIVHLQHDMLFTHLSYARHVLRL